MADARIRDSRGRFRRAGDVRFPVVLDWREYFAEFCRLHGEPIEVGGRLLFPDGWQYSAVNHAGPEYPPPKDPRPLQKAYWLYRIRLVEVELTSMRRQYAGLEEMVRTRSAQLQVRTDGGSSPLDLELLKVQIDVLEEDLSRSKENFSELVGERSD